MKVSVWMSAYNHGKYISQCLDSVLNQKTDFDFEIILGEDCSTDRTREIAIEYKNKHPEKFKLYLPKKISA
ncbi:MAG: glycosyltransferase [Ignavibacteria bacterium]|nr:glycosyltransferase [Ignavibacteria bacterium]